MITFLDKLLLVQYVLYEDVLADLSVVLTAAFRSGGKRGRMRKGSFCARCPGAFLAWEISTVADMEPSHAAMLASSNKQFPLKQLGKYP